MATKPKRVTYNDTIDDNADYLVPLQYDLNPPESIRTKKKSSSGGVYSSIYFAISLLLYAGVPISQFVIGLIYINRCTIQQFIPIYMVLSGIFGITFVVVGLLIYQKMTAQKRSDKPMILTILKAVFILLFLFVLGWFIAGQVIVFQVKTYVELFDPDLPEYCHGNLYKPAYILIFVDYLILLTAIILMALGRSAPEVEEGAGGKKKQKQQRQRPTRK